MKRIAITIMALLCVTTIWAQQNSDTINKNTPKTWKGFFPGIRLAAGIQKSFYYEAGLSFQKYAYDGRRGYSATCFYLCYERTTTSAHQPVNGFKIGIENVVNGGTSEQ